MVALFQNMNQRTDIISIILVGILLADIVDTMYYFYVGNHLMKDGIREKTLSCLQPTEKNYLENKKAIEDGFNNLPTLTKHLPTYATMQSIGLFYLFDFGNLWVSLLLLLIGLFGDILAMPNRGLIKLLKTISNQVKQSNN